MRVAAALVAAAICTGIAGGALAQPTTTPLDADWRDAEAPPPPPLRTTGLIPIEVPSSGLRYGVDPASVAVSPEGVVRYVVVATSPQGATNAMYEGIRCKPGVVKVYARYDPVRGWVKADSEWKQLLGSSRPVRHSMEIARLGACASESPNGPPEQIVRDLGSSWDLRGRNESR